MSKGIICLCGSTRFYRLFDEMNYFLTANGYIVLSIGCHSQSDYSLGIAEIESIKDQLDVLHKEKIAMADAVLILDKDAYIGESTKSELEYAKKLGKPVFFYSRYEHLNLKHAPVAVRTLAVAP